MAVAAQQQQVAIQPTPAHLIAASQSGQPIMASTQMHPHAAQMQAASTTAYLNPNMTRAATMPGQYSTTAIIPNPHIYSTAAMQNPYGHGIYFSQQAPQVHSQPTTAMQMQSTAPLATSYVYIQSPHTAAPLHPIQLAPQAQHHSHSYQNKSGSSASNDQMQQGQSQMSQIANNPVQLMSLSNPSGPVSAQSISQNPSPFANTNNQNANITNLNSASLAVSNNNSMTSNISQHFAGMSLSNQAVINTTSHPSAVVSMHSISQPPQMAPHPHAHAHSNPHSHMHVRKKNRAIFRLFFNISNALLTKLIVLISFLSITIQAQQQILALPQQLT
jgi:hypothetical protein